MIRSALHQILLKALILVLLLGVRHLPAQVLYGALSGTVTDSTGAVVPGATVNVTNVGTGQQVGETTDASGLFLCPNLQEGQYTLVITAKGFKTFAKKGIAIMVNATRHEDIQLVVGATSEQITVSADALELQTDKTDLHTNLTSADVTNLPLGHYRNYQSLVNLVPGATPGVIVNSLQTTPERSMDVNVNGVNKNNNDTRIDGIQSVYLWLRITLPILRRRNRFRPSIFRPMISAPSRGWLVVP